MSEDSESPCIGVCKIDNNNICIGCYRTKEEIANWTKYDINEREYVNRKAEDRKIDAFNQ